MPFVPRLFIRTALAWFAFGMLWAAFIMLLKVTDRPELKHAFITAHTHILLVGFFLNAILGVAFWMFPRPTDRRMNEPLAVLAYALLNLGLVMRVAFEWAWEEHGTDALGVALGTAGVMQALGALLFLVVIWPRVRAVRPPPHLAAGRQAGDGDSAS
jgi:hypothetical protein